MALTREDWDVFSGPNEFFAALGDRILHEEIPEQAEEFWNDFLDGRGGRGFSRLDRKDENGVNRSILLEAYRKYYPGEVVVRSKLNELWHKLLLTQTDLGFVDFEKAEPEARPASAAEREAALWKEWEIWANDPETPMKAILDKRRTDPKFREFYDHYAAAERTSSQVFDGVENLNVRQAAPSASTPTSKKVASPEVQRFAADYRNLSTEQIKTLLSPGRNPQGPGAAAHAQSLFDQACAFGLI